MAYVNVPKDLTKVKTKVLFNLTKRQLICFGSGALIGLSLIHISEPTRHSIVSRMVKEGRWTIR